MAVAVRNFALCTDPASWHRASDGRPMLPFTDRHGTHGAIYKEQDDGPARAVKPGWRERPNYLLASLKSSTAIYCESALERDAYLHFEFDRSIARYRAQPFTVEYATKPILRTYPDTELEHVDGSRTIVQVKMQKTYEKHLEKPHFRDEAALFRSLGWKYVVLTELQIRVEPRLENLKLIHHYRDMDLPEDKRADIIQQIESKPGVTIAHLSKTLKRHDVHSADIIALIGQYAVRTDLDRPIDDTSMIYPL